MEENERLDVETQNDGLISLRVTPEEAKKLRALLSRRASGIQKPRVTREGNKIIIDTGLSDHCIIGQGTPQEIHALNIYQQAEKWHIGEGGEQRIVDRPALTVIETIQGDFVYMDGKQVSERSDLDILPKGHRERALKWFDSKQAGKEVEVEPAEKESVAEHSQELSVREKAVIGLVKGTTGKALAKALGISEGMVSLHKRWAIKNKILTRDGKKFTSEGLEKYGNVQLGI